MPEKKHYSEKGGHKERSRFTFTQRLRERYFPGMHFRAVTAPATIQSDQASWVRRARQPHYDRR